MVTCTGHIGIHEGADGRTYVRCTYGRWWRHGYKTKFSHIDGLPYFLNYGAPRARGFGARGAPLLITHWPFLCCRPECLEKRLIISKFYLYFLSFPPPFCSDHSPAGLWTRPRLHDLSVLKKMAEGTYRFAFFFEALRSTLKEKATPEPD